MNRATKQREKIPKVRLARAPGRPIQLRYTDPASGREVRITTGTHDEAEAIEQRDDLQAKLRLGIAPERHVVKVRGPAMSWQEFRELYRTTQLVTLRGRSADCAESRLDICERILKPRTLGDVASADALHRLQARLLAGDEGFVPKPKKPKKPRRKKGQPAPELVPVDEAPATPRPRSPHTVRSYMAVVCAALNWAALQEWLPAVPRIRKVKASKLRHMKGRPITGEEFDRMIAAVEKTVGSEVAPSWEFLLRGLWASALRLEEIMSLSWDLPGTIQPVWSGRRHGVLEIPAAMQKNDTEESIPMLPWFETVLGEVKEADRTGWVFNPGTLATRLERTPRFGRATAEWVGRVVTRIGKASGVVVTPGQDGRATKYASAHDLRRSCAERLLDAGVPPLTIARVMRHASFETTRRHYAPGSVQKDAAQLKAYLGTVSGAVVVSQ